MDGSLGSRSTQLLQLLIRRRMFVGRNEVPYDVIELLLLGC